MPTSIDALKPYRTPVQDNGRWAGFESRAGDIFVCTPAKCGTTWMQAIVASLLWPEGNAPGAILEISPWLEFEVDPIDEVLAHLSAQRHRRFIKTHTPLDGIPLFPEAKYICVARDGRDAFMSFCNHMEHFKDDIREGLNTRAAAEGIPPVPGWNGDIHLFFAIWLQLLGMLEHAATFWDHRKEANVLLVHFNDMKADLDGEMRRVAEFLGIRLPDSQWPAAIERCTFESMREQGSRLGEFDRLFQGGAKSFIFKGTNGRWKDVLTPEELETYGARVAELLPPAAALWLERGRHAADPRSA